MFTDVQVAGMRDPEHVLTNGASRLVAALDAVDDLFYCFDTDDRLVAWNRAFAAVTGYDDADLLGMASSEFVREQDRGELAAYLERVETGDTDSVELELLTADGETIPYEFYSDRLTDDGTVVGRVGIGRDVTERAEYRRALERENRRLEEFASTVAHDLRNPLTVAQGRARLLDGDLDGQQAEDLEAVLESLDRIERIIGDVLELARTGDLAADPEPVDVGELAGRVWTDIEYGLAVLTVEDPPTIMADASLLERLLTNLLRNTIEHLGDDVAVRVGRLSSTPGFYVADDGPGIPVTERDVIFEWGHSTKSDGFGIGLQSVRETCRAHGWDVVATESRDGGARFEITGVTLVDE